MKSYLVFGKGIYNKFIVSLFLSIIMFFVLFNLKAQKDVFIFIIMATSLMSLVLISNKLSFYYNTQSSISNYSPIINTFLMMPVKRKMIVFWEFLVDIVVLLFYIAIFNIVFFINANIHPNYHVFYSFYTLFVSPFATNIFLLSMFGIFMGSIFFVKNKAIATFLSLVATLFWFVPIFAAFYLTSSASGKKVESFLNILYTDSKHSLFYLVISLLCFIISFVLNLISIYKREI